MFIRYNETTHIWEYDSSIAKAGSGPWIILPNIAFLDQPNTFIQNQSIIKAGPSLILNDSTSGVDNRVARIVAIAGSLYLTTNPDDISGNQTYLLLDRTNGVHTSGPIYERGRTIPIGEWQDVPFNAANFGAAGGTWAVSSATQRFTIIGKTLYYKVVISNSSIGAAPSELLINLPSGYTSVGLTVSSFVYEEAGGGNLVGILYTASDSNIHLRKQAAGTWNTSTNSTTVYVIFAFEIA